MVHLYYFLHKDKLNYDMVVQKLDFCGLLVSTSCWGIGQKRFLEALCIYSYGM